MTAWEIPINQVLRRSEIHRRLGGQRFGGISTPQGSRDILIFTDPKAGAEFGYDKHEGLGEDGAYRYTGAGQVGDMSIAGVNKTILESPESGKVIRLFLANSPFATYKGSFTLADERYSIEKAPDRNGDLREVIVFNLSPIDADTSELPEFGGIAAVTTTQALWTEPNWETYLAVQKSRGVSVKSISRSELQLQAEFGNWLIAKGHRLISHPLKSGNTMIFPDIFDETTMTVFEAKRSSGREFVRTAIGQVLDYQHVAKGLGQEVQCGILLPGEPVQAMISLCNNLEISMYVRSESKDANEQFKKIC
jgi:hypothetical protein